MSMPFSPCPSDGSACSDASVEVLSRVFGPIIHRLTQGQSVDDVDAMSSTLASMLSIFNGGIVVVAGMLLTFIVMFGVMHTANDGEVMGKNWSVSSTILRIVAGAGLLLPTTSGYSIIQTIVLTISLWAVGLANTVYETGVEHGIIGGNLGVITAQMGITDKTTNESYALADIRTFAEGLTTSLYCAHVGNRNFRTAAGNSPAIGIAAQPESIIEEAHRTVKHYAFSDRNKVTSLVGGSAVCGVITLHEYKQQVSPTDLGNTGAKELQALRFAIYQAKSGAMIGMMGPIKEWVDTWPSSVNDLGHDGIQSNRLNEIVRDAENAFLSGLGNRVRGDEALNTILTNYVAETTRDGWLYAGGFYQRLGEARGMISEYMTEQVATITGPDLSSLPDSAQARVMINSQMVPDVVRSKALSHRTNITPADVGSIIQAEIGSSMKTISVASVAPRIEGVLNSWISQTMQTVMATLLGTSGDVDAIARIKTTGDIFAAMAGMGMKTDALVHRTISAARVVAAAAGSASFVGTGVNLEPAVRAVLDWVLYVFLEPLASLISWMHILAFYFGVFLPSLPYTIFIIAAVGFFLQVLQTLVAAPLWAMMHMVPERTFIGSQTQGYLLMLSLLVRPALMVIGLFAAFILINPILAVVTEAFFAMRSAVSGGTFWLINFLQFKNWLIVYGFLLLPIMFMVFGLSQTLPDAVLRWIGVNIQSLGETQATSEMRSNTEKYGPSPAISGTGSTRLGGPSGGSKPMPGIGGGPSSRGGGRAALPASLSSNQQGITSADNR